MRQRLTAVVLALAMLAASASEAPVSRSGSSKPNPTSVSSCSEWKSVYVTHWLKLPQCHSGASTAPCCELYDLMAKTILIFNDKLDCKFTDFHQYAAKFTTHCSSTGRIPDAGATTHGSGPVDVSEDAGGKPATGHTSTGGGGCIGSNCGGGCVGSHCGVGCPGGNCGGKRPCYGANCGGGCTGGYCGGGCTGGNCGGGRPPCYGTHCGGGCTGANCGCVGGVCNKPPVTACVGVNCGCAQCCVGVNCGTGTVTGTAPSTGGTPNQGPFFPRDDDDDVCFHGDGVVKLQDGGVKLMRELRVGDFVHVGRGKFSEVFMFTHQDASKRSTYVNMTVGSGEWVMVTPTHYMYSDTGLQLAGNLKEGDLVEMEDGRMEEIMVREVVRDKGLYNPQTFDGRIAVNGFRASTYTKTIQYETAHSLLAPLRAMFRICGAHISWAF